ncbi:putative CRISPR-associated protein [Coleofasciculus chthonoplastes]|uniref:putative CRISPR-associated protein n=1 Tax=Coleofasciculus chthonoplastes TaxID=64178 RepID=UPI0032FA5DC5
MPRLVISTVGTSLLTNQIDDECDSGWKEELQKYANLTHDRVKQYDQVNKSDSKLADKIAKLKNRAEQELDTGNTLEIREASAELNGIYGLYDEQLEKGKLDAHILVTTDTAQGQEAAKILKDFLHGKVNSVEVYTPDKLSTESTHNFNQGIDDLIEWLEGRVENYRQQNYDIYFNLVGGFKALQGCMNTIGMFYADKIIYVFEGENSNLITIPRLPITVDYSRLEDHVVTLALLDAGAGLSPSETKEVPEAMVAEIDGKMTLSNWGQLVWNQCKDNLLSQKLLDGFLRIHYDGSFMEDYKKIKNPKDKVKLQETIAKASFLLEESNGDTRALAKPVSYYAYKGTKDKEGVDHFYVGRQFRVSCKSSNGTLILRHYGTHKYVEGKEIKN